MVAIKCTEVFYEILSESEERVSYSFYGLAIGPICTKFL